LNSQNDGAINGPALWTKDYLLVLFGNLFVFLGIIMLIPTFPAYIKQLGGNDVQAALPFAVVSLSALLVRPISGYIADAFGRRLLLVMGMGIVIVFNAGFFAVSSIGLILVLRFLQGFGWGMTSTAFGAIVSDIVPAGRRIDGIGYYAVTIILGSSAANILGIELMTRFGFQAVLAASVFLVGCGLLMTQFMSLPPLKQHSANIGAKSCFSWDSLAEKRALLPALLCFLYSMTFGGIMSFLLLFGAEQGIQNIGVFFIGHVSMILVSRPFIGRLYEWRGQAQIILVGVALMMAGLLVLSFAASSSQVLAAALLYGLGYGATHPSVQAWAIDRSPADRLGATNGTFLSSLDLGYSVGPVLLGLVAERSNYAFMFRSSLVFLVGFILIYGYYLLQEKRLAGKELACDEEIA
jgi:MFS family permease